VQLGIQLTILIGPTIPVPAPILLLEALDSVEVVQSDVGRSGFQMSLRVSRGDPSELLDYTLLSLPLLRPFNRVVMIVTVDFTPRVLFDGFITHQQLKPGESLLVITGEDVSLMMDMEEKSSEYPNLDETLIVNTLLLTYIPKLGLIPVVTPPPLPNPPPLITDRVPVQHGTDLEYIKLMAERFGYVFYIVPGPAPLTNTAYWGPPRGFGLPQPALSINLSNLTNVESLTFKNEAHVPTTVAGFVQDRRTNLPLPVIGVPLQPALRFPILASQPSWLVNQPNVRKKQFRESGLTIEQALNRAAGIADAATEVVTAEGELDAVRYGDILQPHALVGVRGAGITYDGFYYVKRVKHMLRAREGDYKQQFTLTREGVGTTTPVVRP
jgi:hypothetical protein